MTELDPERTGVMIYGKKRIPVEDAVLDEREGRLGWWAISNPDVPPLRVRMFYPKDMFTFETVAEYLKTALESEGLSVSAINRTTE